MDETLREFVRTGSNDAFAAVVPGIELLTWSEASGTWVPLGMHTARPGDDVATRTILAAPAGPVPDFALEGRIWLMAVPLYPASSRMMRHRP